jgi:hypothetical protein
LEPFFDAAKEWLGGIFKDWLFGEKAKPPRRNLQGEAQAELAQRERKEPERRLTKDQLLEQLREKQEQRRLENRQWE